MFVVAAPCSGAAALGRALGNAAVCTTRRVGELADTQPGSRFIYLYRDPREAIAIAVHRGEAVEAAVAEWRYVTSRILDDMASLPADAWIATTYAVLCGTPRRELTRIASFARLPLSSEATFVPDDAAGFRDQTLAILPRMSAIADVNAKAKLVCAACAETPRDAHTTIG